MTYLRSVDLVNRTIPGWRAQARVEDALHLVRLRCGGLDATLLQLDIHANGAVTSTAAILGGALDECADQVIRDVAFEPACNGTTALFTLDPEGVHAEVHHISPAE